MNAQRGVDCVASVVTEDFMAGALVAFRSFQSHNRWFSGEFVVIHDGQLTPESKECLESAIAGVRFVNVSERLQHSLDALFESRPDIAARRARFYSLEAFLLAEYSSVLYFDSDVLFRGDVHSLYEMAQPLIACPDRPTYLRKARDPRTFALCDAGPNTLENTFNAGLLRIDRSLLNETEYSGLLELLSSSLWESTTASHTDQLVLNHYFSGRQHLVDGTYNFLMSRAPLLKDCNVNHADARMIHFNVSVKPWQTQKLLSFAPRSPVFFQALTWWNEEFEQCLQHRYLKKHLART